MGVKKIAKGIATICIAGGVIIGGGYYVASKVVQSYEGLALPNTKINGVVVSGKTQQEIEAIINHKINALSNREITIRIDDLVKKITVKEFNPTFNQTAVELSKKIIENQKGLSVLEQLELIFNPLNYSHEILFTVSDDVVAAWVEELAEEVKVLPIEPTVKKDGDSFVITQGKEGYSLDSEKLKGMLITELENQTHEPAELALNLDLVKPTRDIALLEKINEKVATYSSQFDASISRAKNVINASNKINGVLLMPGEEFSYTEHTLPVTLENGYGYGTIFVNGTTAQGLGGGMCQVSSTLYNTMLEAGILATERRAHSLPVGYVPAGQDATMTDTGIDLKFINTLDYPIYIESTTVGGVLTISFWSNQNALKGIDYEAKSHVYNNGYSADTTLYGYKNGELVYEKFLHTSTYKKPY